jgi:hypothetical protein
MRVLLTDVTAVDVAVAEFAPDAIVHCAIMNDFEALETRRGEAWAAYVGSTGALADAANRAGAQLVLVSTDWVFDGTQGGADEATPPRPINAFVDALEAGRRFAGWLDASLLEFAPPPAAALPPGPVPYDTSLSGPATEAALETRLPDVDALLSGLRTELGRERSLV